MCPFWAWLLSLDMELRFSLVVVLVTGLFFVKSHSLFIYRPADGCLGCSQFGAVTSRTALGVLGHVLLGIGTRFSWLHPGLALPRHRWLYFGVGASGQGLL